jgi:hypothetical protein
MMSGEYSKPKLCSANSLTTELHVQYYKLQVVSFKFMLSGHLRRANGMGTRKSLQIIRRYFKISTTLTACVKWIQMGLG